MRKAREAALSASAATMCAFAMDVGAWLRTREATDRALHVSEPREIAWFSRGGACEARAAAAYGSREQLRTFARPALPADLNAGFEDFKAKDGPDARGDVLEVVRAVLNQPGGSTDLLRDADVVTYRNNLNKLGFTPYNTRDVWAIDAVLVEGVMFLDIVDSDDLVRTENQRAPPASADRFTYYGYRFEQLCTSGLGAIDASNEFCTIVRLRLAQQRVLLAAEIDCEQAHATHAPAPGGSRLRSYVELKTMRQPTHARQWQNAEEQRFCKYWIQSYLAGVPTIQLGLRDDRGILLDVVPLQTRELGSRSKGSRMQHVRWDPFVCLNFICAFLATARHELSRAQRVNPKLALRFSYDPRARRVDVCEAPTPKQALHDDIRALLLAARVG